MPTWEDAFVYKIFTIFAITGDDLMTFCQVANGVAGGGGPALPAAQPTFMSGYPAAGTPAVEQKRSAFR